MGMVDGSGVETCIVGVGFPALVVVIHDHYVALTAALCILRQRLLLRLLQVLLIRAYALGVCEAFRGLGFVLELILIFFVEVKLALICHQFVILQEGRDYAVRWVIQVVFEPTNIRRLSSLIGQRIVTWVLEAFGMRAILRVNLSHSEIGLISPDRALVLPFLAVVLILARLFRLEVAAVLERAFPLLFSPTLTTQL